jgi:hypothetical protein
MTTSDRLLASTPYFRYSAADCTTLATSRARHMPWRLKNASTTRSSLTSAPVCDSAAAAPGVLRVGVLVQEGVFSTLGNDLTVYARKRDADGTLRGIMVHDQREAGGASCAGRTRRGRAAGGVQWWR